MDSTAENIGKFNQKSCSTKHLRMRQIISARRPAQMRRENICKIQTGLATLEMLESNPIQAVNSFHLYQSVLSVQMQEANTPCAILWKAER